MVEKITLSADNLYIIRSTQTFVDGNIKVKYYETPSIWNTCPTMATIFQTYEAGEGHLNMYSNRDKAPKGWFDKRKEVLDVVPLYGEILQSSNGKTIKLD